MILFARALLAILVFHVAFIPVARAQGVVPNIAGYLPPVGMQYVPASSNVLPGVSRTAVPLYGRITTTLSSVTMGEITTMTTGGNVTKAFVGGARILSRGNLVIAGLAALSAAGSWYFNSTSERRNANNSLAAWYRGEPELIADVFWEVAYQYPDGKQYVRITYNARNVDGGFTGRIVIDVTCGSTCSIGDIGSTVDNDIDRRQIDILDGPWTSTGPFTGVKKVTPTLAEHFRMNQSSREEASRVWPAFVADRGLRKDKTIPGVNIDPDGELNENQWEDDAVTGADTDGDGASDDAELQLNHLPITPWEPYVPPPPVWDPNYDSDNDGYSDPMEDGANTPLTDPTEHPPGRPDRPLEPWEEDPRLHDPPPDPTPGDSQVPSPGDADGDGTIDGNDDYITPPDPTPGDGVVPTPGDDNGNGVPDVEEGEDEENPPAPVVDPTPGDGVIPTPGDQDGDGVPDSQDDYITPPDPTPGDGIVPTPGDDNGDGVPDQEAPGEDPDGDGSPNESDPDDDGDGIPDETDEQPYVPYVPGDHPTEDPDGDGIPNSEDPNPLVPDLEPTETPDTDNDGVPDHTDTDDDNDGIPDVSDPNPTTPDPDPGTDTGTDPTPGDGVQPSPGDQDGDGVPDVDDPYVTPPDPTPGDGIQPSPGDGNGDGVPDEDEGPGDGPGDGTGEGPGDGGGTGEEPPVEPPDDETVPGDPGEQDYFRPLNLPLPNLTYAEELFRTVREKVSTEVISLTTLAQSKMPFGLPSWIPVLSVKASSGECQGIPITILGKDHEVGICDTPIDLFLAGPGRVATLLVAMLMFYMASARVMAAS